MPLLLKYRGHMGQAASTVPGAWWVPTSLELWLHLLALRLHFPWRQEILKGAAGLWEERMGGSGVVTGSWHVTGPGLNSTQLTCRFATTSCILGRLISRKLSIKSPSMKPVAGSVFRSV